MQPEFSPTLTRLDAVMWFLRVQMWVTVVALIVGLPLPYYGLLRLLNPQTLITLGVPILILAIFPRVLAASVLGDNARDPLNVPDLRTLVRSCVGLAVFVSSIGRTLLSVLALGEAFYSRGSFISSSPIPGYYPAFLYPQVIGSALAFFIGFFLAFGPVIRDSFRAR